MARGKRKRTRTDNEDKIVRSLRDRKRPKEEVLDFDEFFIGVAYLASMRSKNPEIQSGACIVNKKQRIIGTGYNGMPDGCDDDEFPWKSDYTFKDLTDGKEEKRSYYECHAELNAILNTNGTDMTGCRMYVLQFPCNECAKAIIQSGIRAVSYLSDPEKGKSTNKAARKMFEANGFELKLVEVRRNIAFRSNDQSK